MDLTQAITEEVYRALKRLGSLERPARDEMYAALERAGADRFLLATVGSWGDCMSDEEVLRDLQALNEGAFEFETYASTSEPAAVMKLATRKPN